MTEVGQRVRLESAKYFPATGYRSSRITSITQNILRPTEMDLEISDVLGKGYLAGIGMTIGTAFGRIAGVEAARAALV